MASAWCVKSSHVIQAPIPTMKKKRIFETCSRPVAPLSSTRKTVIQATAVERRMTMPALSAVVIGSDRIDAVACCHWDDSKRHQQHADHGARGHCRKTHRHIE